MIDIVSNGSKWAGESPDTIEDLLAVLATHPLDRIFEKYGNFINPDPQWGHPAGNNWIPGPGPYGGLRVTAFFGNFYTVSHVFNICTDEPDTIEKLTRAILANKQRADYLSQPDPKK